MGLRHIFGDKPVPRIIDFLLVHREWDYPISTLAEATGVSYRTVQKIIPQLVIVGILKATREVRKAKMYALNFDSESVKRLDALALAADLEFAGGPAVRMRSMRHTPLARRRVAIKLPA
jgi:hypothetical protein